MGSIAASLLLLAQGVATGGPAGLLQVGEQSQLRPVIESQLGDIPLARGGGHDGQIYYAIGLDLTGEFVPDLIDHGAYRYRRMLYPALASLFGLLKGEQLLVGMVLVSAASVGVATGATAAIARHLGRSEWLALAVILNPGVWLSARLLTADALALALMLAALYAVLTANRLALGAFAMSGLTKEVFLTTPVGLAMDSRRRHWPLVVIPCVLLVGWMTWLTVSMGEGFSSRGNLGLPFLGLLDSSQVWPQLGLEELTYVGFALTSVLGGLVYAVTVKSWLRWSILGWAVLGLISSSWIWDLGNNAARSFAPLLPLVVIAAASRKPDRPIAMGSDSILLSARKRQVD